MDFAKLFILLGIPKLYFFMKISDKSQRVIAASVISAAALYPLTVEAKTAPKQPNIIYIMSDDHAAHAIGAYGGRLAPLNPTPNIDAFAREAVVFDNCFCSNSISAPSRATIMTGQHSHVNGVLTLSETLQESQLYLANEMKELGYQTAFIGKWHLGCEPSVFDFYSMFSGGNGQGTYFDPSFATSDIKDKPFPKNEKFYKGHSSDIVTDIALEWFENKRTEDKPFFVMFQYKAPHEMFQPAPRYKDYLADVEIPLPETLLDRSKFGSAGSRGINNSQDSIIGTSISARHNNRPYTELLRIKEQGSDEKNTIAAYNEYLRRYLRCVKGIDDNIERLFKYLKANGLWDKCIIVYTADQGMILGEHDFQDKRWMYETSIRMPFIMRVPKSKLNGSHNDRMLGNVDFAPTLLALAGRENKPNYMQGLDFSPIFSGEKATSERKTHYYRYWMHMEHHDIPAHFGIRTKEYKLIFFYGRHYKPEKEWTKSMGWLRKSNYIIQTPVAFELYDIKNDPHETTNLAQDPKYASVLAELKKELIATKLKCGDNDATNPEILRIINENF